MKKIFILLFLSIIGNVAFAQIPNSSFETWDSSASTPGYSVPNGWDNLDSVTHATGIYTCTKGTGGCTGGGSYYLALRTQTIPLLGVLPGVAATGKFVISGTTYSVKGGFPCTSRPQSLIGNWEYMAYGSDRGQIAILLTKWNTVLSKRDTVALTNQTLSGMVMLWAGFSINLNYLKGENPDSALIVFSSSGQTGAVANSYLNIDSLAFSGSVPNGVISVTEHTFTSSIFPNPAAGNANIRYYSPIGQNIQIYITDINGKIVKSIITESMQGTNLYSLNTLAFAQGIYFVKIINEQGTDVHKLIIE